MVKPTPPTAPEAPLRSDAAFSAKAQTFLTWLSGGFYSYVEDLVDFVDERADEALAAATTFGFPSIAGKGLNLTRVNAAGTALEFRTPAQVRGDLGATTIGASVFTAADAAAARSAIGAPPLPTLATALGQDRSLNSGAGNALIAPSGGQWRVYWQSIIVSTGGVASHGVYVGEGGGTIQNAVAGINHIGFAWRIA
jgi:hypothetical protein